MRAILSKVAGGPRSLEVAELPEPQCAAGKLLVRTAAVALNYPDLLLIADRYQVRPTRPFSPGVELAGVIEELGCGVEGFKAGDRIAAFMFYGALAEKVLVDPGKTIKIPSEMPMDAASALLITYGTAHYALKTRGQLVPGETLLILGASGGVGLAAIELGKAAGARVVAAVSNEGRADAVRAAGADVVLVHPPAPLSEEQRRILAQEFKRVVGPDGAHVVFDTVGGDLTEPALRAIARRGRFLVIGFTAGIASIRTNLPLLKECSVIGAAWGDAMEANHGEFKQLGDELIALWQHGAIKPLISQRYPIQEAGTALEALEARTQAGRIVVQM